MANGVGLTHFACIVKLGRPENPLFGAGILLISHIQVELNTDFLFKFSNFRYHGNKGGSSKILNDSL